jgi:hypothetical protein
MMNLKIEVNTISTKMEINKTVSCCIQSARAAQIHSLVHTVDRTEVRPELRGIRASLAPAPEELGFRQMVAPVGCPPQSVRVADRQVLASENRFLRVNDQTALRREALRTVGATAVLQ